jgi:non-ribosomal peptide synthetase component F
VHTLFERQAARTPDATAIVHEDASLSYAALDAHANRLAHYLCGKGVQAGYPRRASAWTRGIDMVLALLAVLEGRRRLCAAGPGLSGRAPGLHAGRQRSGWLLLTHAWIDEQTQGDAAGPAWTRSRTASSTWKPMRHKWSEEGQVRIFHAACNRCRTARNLAYVIYTSGSTGQPKGVMVAHRAWCNRLRWMQDAVPADAIEASSGYCSSTSFSFDVSVSEFFWPRCSRAPR